MRAFLVIGLEVDDESPVVVAWLPDGLNGSVNGISLVVASDVVMTDETFNCGSVIGSGDLVGSLACKSSFTTLGGDKDPMTDAGRGRTSTPFSLGRGVISRMGSFSLASLGILFASPFIFTVESREGDGECRV